MTRLLARPHGEIAANFALRQWLAMYLNGFSNIYKNAKRPQILASERHPFNSFKLSKHRVGDRQLRLTFDNDVVKEWWGQEIQLGFKEHFFFPRWGGAQKLAPPKEYILGCQPLFDFWGVWAYDVSQLSSKRPRPEGQYKLVEEEDFALYLKVNDSKVFLAKLYVLSAFAERHLRCDLLDLKATWEALLDQFNRLQESIDHAASFQRFCTPFYIETS